MTVSHTKLRAQDLLKNINCFGSALFLHWLNGGMGGLMVAKSVSGISFCLFTEVVFASLPVFGHFGHFSFCFKFLMFVFGV